jgi:hypothetical protein
MKKLVLLGILVVLSLSSAWADEAPASTNSQTNQAAGIAAVAASNGVSVETTTGPSAILDNTYLVYSASFHGPTLGKMDSFGTDHTGTYSKRNMIMFDGDLTAGYMVTKDTGIGPYVPFFLYPVQGQGAVLGDVGVKLVQKHIVQSNGWSVAGAAMIQAPTNDYSKYHTKMDLGLKFTPYIMYRPSGSRFTYGVWTEQKAYLGVVSDKTFKLWAQPYVSYRMTPTLSANLAYEAEADHFYGKPTLDFTSYQTDLCPGVIWNVTPKIFINPYVQFFTGNKVTKETTALGAYLSAALL